jgi:transcriptional regulator with XRE-family HTH domain
MEFSKQYVRIYNILMVPGGETHGRLGITHQAIPREPRPMLSLIETGERKVSADEIKRLGDIFNISVDAFFDERKDPHVVITEAGAENKMAQSEIRIDIPLKNIAKFKEVFLYVLNKVGAKPNVGETVLYKLLYFIDFDYYEQYEEQLIPYETVFYRTPAYATRSSDAGVS